MTITARYANRQSGRGSNLETVGSTPTRATPDRVVCLRTCGGPPGRLLAAAFRAMWVRFPPGALEMRNAELGTRNSEYNPNSEFQFRISWGSFFQRPGYQVVNLAMRVQFPHEPLNNDGPFVSTAQDDRFSACKWGSIPPRVTQNEGIRISECEIKKSSSCSLREPALGTVM